MEERPKVSITRYGIRYGLIALVLLVAYMLIIQAMGEHRPFFRILNYIIIAVVIYFAYRNVSKQLHHHRFEYLPGLGLGMYIAIFTALTFGIWVAIYAGVINPKFIDDVKASGIPFADYLNGASIGFVAGAEIAVAGIVSSFIFMQLFKRNRSEETEVEEEAKEHFSKAR